MRNRAVILLFVLSIKAVIRDETEVVESVSVTVGDSLTLQTNVSQIEPNGVLDWRFGEKIIASVNNDPKNITHGITNASDRLELNRQTGNLKITNVKMADSGLYKLEIFSPSGSTRKKFYVIVNDTVSDGVKVESVRERDSVILPTGLDQLQRDDRLTWKFKKTIIAQINQTCGMFTVYDAVLDRRFKDRLLLNKQDGSLIITSVRLNISGLYEVEINRTSRGFSTHKTFSVSVIDGDDMLSVTEGTSATFQSGIFKIHQADVIIWRCEHGDSVIAKISNGTFSTFDGADGRFRDTLELDHKTGSLTIQNIKTGHAGLYHMDMIGSRRTIFKRISLSVYSHVRSAVLYVSVAFLLGLSVSVAVFCRSKICRRKEKRCKHNCKRSATGKLQQRPEPEGKGKKKCGQKELDLMLPLIR
ncbi:uncharacterized protein LOC130216143 [Danio aesculapii]|uniref:uncharacterized protein LOC130216143 n=1 Tax=Danio aesculapii TaxID=1142201 RepID=UPI0024BF1B53|nr:uncharacterized protein LOC130216143 [Danio aesculapii]